LLLEYIAIVARCRVKMRFKLLIGFENTRAGDLHAREWWGRIGLKMEQMPLITVTTDFGIVDGYVGTMKGVVLGIAPNARIVDISHEIAPQDIRQAAYVLYTAYPFFPPQTVHLVVVDPGVGSARRPVALRTRAGSFVGPDNGVFSYVMAREQVEAMVELADPQYHLSSGCSHTFHGRDIFAPVAAYLAAGTPISALGPPVPDPITFPPPRLEIAGEGITGEVWHVDRFGNVVTSIGILTWGEQGRLAFAPAFRGAGSRKQEAGGEERETLRHSADRATVLVAGRELVAVRHSYAEVERGQMAALVGSSGHLEIAVREGNAAEKLGVSPGGEVVLRWG
jgi:S-adenosylmethionine hydrolase